MSGELPGAVGAAAREANAPGGAPAAPRPPRWRTRLAALARELRPHRFELVAWGSAAVALLFLRAKDLNYGWNTVLYTFRDPFGVLPRLFLIGLAAQIVVTLVARRSLREYLRDRIRPGTLWIWFRAWMSIVFIIYGYCWLKVSIPLVRPTALFDQELWNADRWLHFGISPSVFLIELVAGTPMAKLLDEWYAVWLLTVPYAAAYMFAHRDRARVKNFALAMAVLWGVGGWSYYALPALGPCYASPDILEPIKDEIPKAIGSQGLLWQNYLTIVKGRDVGVLRTFQPEFGVAALPSLHVAMHAMILLWAWRHERWLRAPAAVATLLTFLGSIATGWHYAIDGYAGILLAWLAVAVADRFERVPGDSRGESDSQVPADSPASGAGAAAVAPGAG